MLKIVRVTKIQNSTNILPSINSKPTVCLIALVKSLLSNEHMQPSNNQLLQKRNEITVCREGNVVIKKSKSKTVQLKREFDIWTRLLRTRPDVVLHRPAGTCYHAFTCGEFVEETITMPFIPKNLDNYFDTTNINPMAIYQTFRLLISAVKAFHEEGIAHNDIKPQNILVSKDLNKVPSELKLIDFGAATKLGFAPVETTLAYSSSNAGQPIGDIESACFTCIDLCLRTTPDLRWPVKGSYLTIKKIRNSIKERPPLSGYQFLWNVWSLCEKLGKRNDDLTAIYQIIESNIFAKKSNDVVAAEYQE